MFSDDTTKRFRIMAQRVQEIVDAFGVPEAQAWVMLTANEAQKAAQVAEKIERRQKEIAEAEMRAKAAYNATFKGGLEGK